MADEAQPKKIWYRGWWYKLPILIVAVVVGLSALVDLGGGGGSITTCEGLGPQIVKLSKEKATPFNPAILKLYEIATVPNTGDRFLNCTAKAKMDRGADRQIAFYASRDADGDEFIGYGSK